MTQNKKNRFMYLMNTNWLTIPLIVVLVIAIFLPIGLSCKRSVKQEIQTNQDQWYTCPMHPEIQQQSPGKCPICGMNLVPSKKQPTTNPTTTKESKVDIRKLNLHRSELVQEIEIK